MAARNGVVEGLDREERAGVGVRALIGRAGASSPSRTSARRPRGVPASRRRPSPARRRACRARTSSSRPEHRDPGSGQSECLEDPWSVDAGREGRPARGRHPDDARARRRHRPGQPPDLGHPQVVRLERGHRDRPAHRRVRRGDDATAVGEGETQRRSLPGHPRPVRDARLGARPRARPAGQRAADRRGGAGPADRRACPALDATDLILGSEQMALQIHESVGHAIELDRILGWEAAFAGTSWLDLSPARARSGSAPS